MSQVVPKYYTTEWVEVNISRVSKIWIYIIINLHSLFSTVNMSSVFGVAVYVSDDLNVDKASLIKLITIHF